MKSADMGGDDRDENGAYPRRLGPESYRGDSSHVGGRQRRTGFEANVGAPQFRHHALWERYGNIPRKDFRDFEKATAPVAPRRRVSFWKDGSMMPRMSSHDVDPRRLVDKFFHRHDDDHEDVSGESSLSIVDDVDDEKEAVDYNALIDPPRDSDNNATFDVFASSGVALSEGMDAEEEQALTRPGLDIDGILGALGVSKDEEIPRNVLMVADVDRIRFSEQRPVGYSVDEVRDVMSQVRSSVEVYTSIIARRLHDIAALATVISRQNTIIQNLTYDERDDMDVEEEADRWRQKTVSLREQLSQEQASNTRLNDSLSELLRENGRLQGEVDRLTAALDAAVSSTPSYDDNDVDAHEYHENFVMSHMPAAPSTVMRGDMFSGDIPGDDHDSGLADDIPGGGDEPNNDDMDDVNRHHE